jgi:hypothetical protein
LQDAFLAAASSQLTISIQLDEGKQHAPTDSS